MTHRKAVLVAMLVITFALTGQAQTLMDRLNDAVLFAEKIDRAIEKGRVQTDVVLYESDEDDEEYLFSGHTTVSLQQTNDGFIRLTTLHESGASGYEAKSLYLNANFEPVVLIDELKHTHNRCFVFEGDEPAIFAEAEWDDYEHHFGDYTIYRITPKEYRYATQMLSQYEHVLEDWVKSVQRKQNKRRIGEWTGGTQIANQNPQAPANQPQLTPEQQLKQAAGAMLIQSLDQALQKWLK
jgi:hypothetical protein